MPANYYDVNVHPTKMEVRFNDEDKLYKVFYHAIKSAMLNSEFLDNNEKEQKKENYIENELQIISMSEIRIPDEKGGKDSSYFTSIRRAYLTAGYAYCILKDRKTTKDLYNLLTLEREELVGELTDAENKSNGLVAMIRMELNNMSLTDNERNILLTEKAKIETYITFMKTARSLIKGTGSQVETNYIALVEMMKGFTFFKLSNTKNLNIRNWIKDDPRSLMVSVPLATKSSSMSVASAFFEVLGRELLSIGENFGIDKDREIHLLFA
jgi:DNA mismatch repair ATPase MutL